ncbi:hypothetical protein Cantr_01756 [Candida viswanathii]|uniref:Vacuolar membrane protein n=1 Tax=Candida viswanathii TaxID=5486 RepID=A0A367YJL0_9ASCO|nr:hypothetical protein Cantr_01756 [Candida viswanathii]
MPIQLAHEEGDEPFHHDHRLKDDEHQPNTFIRLLNSVRCYNIPVLNFVILLILGIFLIKLTTKYTNLYMKNSLITIITTNLVLYGISETLAQSILCYRSDQPMIAYRLNESDGVGNGAIVLNSGVIDDLEEGNVLDDDAVDVVIPLSFFQFNRLAGFMCWGFIMGFCQCWWYKFLQIYSQDPKFIEVVRKVMTDQFLYSPVSLFCFFTYGTIVLEDKTWDDAKIKLKKIYIPTLFINYSVWFPVQFFNFLVIPRSFQVPFSSSISVLWNCYLSMRNSTN